MFCTQCGAAIAEGAKFCGKCGLALRATATPPPLPSLASLAPVPSAASFPPVPSLASLAPVPSLASLPPVPSLASFPSVPSLASLVPPQSETTVAQVRPWVRYWARMLDMYVLFIVAGIGIGVVAPDALNGKPGGKDQLFAVAACFAWVFIESLLLSTFGTTPGKWLLKTKLIPPAGTTLSYSVALSRSIKVWWRGMGTGLALPSLITTLVAYSKLKDKRITSWDRDDGFTVVHYRIGPLRIIVAVTCFGTLLLMLIMSIFIDSPSSP